jgi:peptidyl-prolyl cis-trans isomerase A (cyclophilin A)
MTLLTAVALGLLTGCDSGRHAAAAPPAPDSFLVALETSRGPMQLMVHRDWSPLGVDRLYYLVQNHFYDDARFFRVVPHFVAQFGLPADPAMSQRFITGPLADDPVKHSNLRGTVTYAHAGPGTRSSQLFINLRDNVPLDGQGFSPIGEIREGIQAIDSLNGEYNGPTEPDQHFIETLGNGYLTTTFPRLDYIRTARIAREWKATP